MTLAVPRRTNIPRPTKKDPKDTPDRAFNKLAWGNHYGTEGVLCKVGLLAFLIIFFKVPQISVSRPLRTNLPVSLVCILLWRTHKQILHIEHRTRRKPLANGNGVSSNKPLSSSIFMSVALRFVGNPRNISIQLVIRITTISWSGLNSTVALVHSC